MSQPERKTELITFPHQPFIKELLCLLKEAETHADGERGEVPITFDRYSASDLEDTRRL